MPYILHMADALSELMREASASEPEQEEAVQRARAPLTEVLSLAFYTRDCAGSYLEDSLTTGNSGGGDFVQYRNFKKKHCRILR